MKNIKESGLTRRRFLKTTGIAAGLAAFSAVGCSPAAPTQTSAEGESALADTGDEKVVVGRCNFGGCTVCEREVVVRDGRVVGTRPSSTEVFGRRPCLRAYNAVNRLYADDRIKYPMKRKSWTPDNPVSELRGNDEWERISWDEAIKLICDKWTAVREAYGPHAVIAAGSGGASLGNMAANRLLNAMETVSVDSAIDMGVKVGLWRVCGKNGNVSNKPGHDPWEEDVYEAKSVVAWSSNFHATYTQRWRHLIGAQRNGTRLVVVDPNQTVTADRADSWYRVRPATDTALMNAVCQVIIEENLIDVDFLKEHSAAAALVRRDTGKYLRMSDLGVEPAEGPVDAQGNPTFIDPYAVWDEVGGKAGALDEVADPQLEGSLEVDGIAVDTAFTLLKNHLQDYTPEKASGICAVSPDEIRELARICADGPVLHIDGLGWQQYDNGAATGQALATLMTLTGNLMKPGAGLTPANGAFMPVKGFLNGKATNATGTTTLSIPAMLVAQVAETHQWKGEELPPFKMMLGWGYNFQGGTVDMNATRRMLEGMELVVGINLTMVDTCEYADIVLPAAHFYEKEDIAMTAIERIVPHFDKAVDPLYEAKPDLEIAKLLGNGMGLGEHFQFDQEEFLRMVLDCEGMKERGITLDALRENHSMRWHDPGYMWEDTGWLTESKRLELYCEKPLPRVDFGQEFDPSVAKLPTWVPPAEAYPTTEAMQKYPLVCNTYRTHYRWGFQGHEGVWFAELEPDVVVRVAAGDAKERGIGDGDWVELYNDHGHAVARAWVDAAVRPGMVMVPKGYASKQYKAGNTAELLGSYCDPLCVNQSFYDMCVEMRPWTEE